MPSFKLSPFLVAAAIAVSVHAQDAPSPVSTFPATPLADKHIAYTAIPYKVDTDTNLLRGVQFGYNQCNETTQNQDSDCQTGFLNSVDDFCLWAPSKPNSTIGDTEGEEVAWCTKPGHGTRVIPPGALQGVQFMRTPDYVQVVGFIDQALINMNADDYGGELDPHGADLRGNPMGGLLYSNAWSNGDNSSYTQVIEWHNFMGGGGFCFKACDPAGPNAAHFCEHRLDEIGCYYNAPNNAQKGTYEVCKGDNQDFPGVYTSNGQVMTFTQPPGGIAATTIPYQPKVPASSDCTSYASSDLYASASQYYASSVTGTAAGQATGGSGSGDDSKSTRSATAASALSTSGTLANTNGAGAGAAIAAMGLLSAVAAML